MQAPEKLHALLERFDRREERLLDALSLRQDERQRLSKELKQLREVRDQRIEQLLEDTSPSFVTSSPSLGKRKRALSLAATSEPGKRQETADKFDPSCYLPEEVWWHIFSFLTRRQLLVTSLVSSHWR